MTRDLRHYARQTNARLIAGGLALLFLVGGGLIYVLYGREAALAALICLVIGLSPLILIGLALITLDWLAKRANE